jgi:hypothetical protein
MPGLVPGIHVFPDLQQDVDGRDKPGHDELALLPLSTSEAESLPVWHARFGKTMISTR